MRNLSGLKVGRLVINLLLAAAVLGARAEVRVESGAEVLISRQLDLLKGRRVGLITNHTATVGDRHLIDVLHATEGVRLTALFGPEHGLRGLADAGEKVADAVDPATGVPVFSLYGATREPSPQMLENVDLLVFDIQDVGARFYTYISTLGLSMQAAARKGIPFVVLDRPNPLGGERVDGYVLSPSYTSFVGQYPIPIQHGLTMGELARMVQGEGYLPGLEKLDLKIVAMNGWKRSMLWPDTGLPWIKPSPNLPTFDSAVVYPGTCLFEATSVSEGRGTDAPFQMLGAPWADGKALASSLYESRLEGVAFEAARFTPRSIPNAAANPKLKDVELQGVKITVTDARKVRPVALGVYALNAFYRQTGGFSRLSFYRIGGMSRLAGTERLRQQLSRGVSPEKIIAGWESEVAAFRRVREKYLLYR